MVYDFYTNSVYFLAQDKCSGEAYWFKEEKVILTTFTINNSLRTTFEIYSEGGKVSSPLDLGSTWACTSHQTLHCWVTLTKLTGKQVILATKYTIKNINGKFCVIPWFDIWRNNCNLQLYWCIHIWVFFNYPLTLWPYFIYKW